VVTVEDGTFDSLDAGSSVYVAALKYRPLTGVAVSTFESDAYDVDSWTWTDLTGQSSKTFSLIVPANQQVYLWAYADEDVDGVVNQTGEAVASGGTNDNGGINTGTSDSSWSLALMYN
jgi:hypothetical protein